MEKFLKENWFKVGLLVVVVVATLLYFRSAEQSKSLVNSIRCQQESSQLLERMRGELSSKESYDQVEFRFAPKLNTCLFNGVLTIRNNNGSIYVFTHFIRDVYTNMDLARYDTFVNDDGQRNDFGEKEEYNLLEVKYFSE